MEIYRKIISNIITRFDKGRTIYLRKINSYVPVFEATWIHKAMLDKISYKVDILCRPKLKKVIQPQIKTFLIDKFSEMNKLAGVYGPITVYDNHYTLRDVKIRYSTPHQKIRDHLLDICNVRLTARLIVLRGIGDPQKVNEVVQTCERVAGRPIPISLVEETLKRYKPHMSFVDMIKTDRRFDTQEKMKGDVFF